jgi:putative ABC transport system permease protein
MTASPGRFRSEIAQDLRFGASVLRTNKSFALAAVLALALGLGANTAIFSVVYAALLRPMPYPQADRLVTVSLRDSRTGDTAPLTNAAFFQLKAQSRSLEMLAFTGADWNANVTGGGAPERVRGMLVPVDLLALLGMRPARGRTFSSTEEEPGQNGVVLISDGLWHKRFNGDEHVIGRSLTVNGRSFTVTGVVPPDFLAFPGVEMWSPLVLTAAEKADNRRNAFGAIARLSPGVTLEQARMETAALTQASQEGPLHAIPIQITALREELSTETRPALLMLLVAVVFILLIACANVANLMLARTVSRRAEMALRLALGASRGRLIRQVLTESVLLAALGGGLGLLLAAWLGTFLSRGLPEYLLFANPHLRQPGLSGPVLLFSAVITVVTSVVFGMTPAVQAASAQFQDALKGERGPGDGRGARLREALMAVEVAIAMLLLVGSTLMLKSFWLLTHVNPGFEARHALTMDVALSESDYSDGPARVRFFDEVLERLGHLPGVSAAGAVNVLPLGGGTLNTGISAQDDSSAHDSPSAVPNWRAVTPEYFRAIGTPLLQGRFFTAQDSPSSPLVAIISESLARRLAPAGSAIGRRIKIGDSGSPAPWLSVVGVVEDIRADRLAHQTPLQFYQPYAQSSRWTEMSIVIRSLSDPKELGSAARQQVLAVDPMQPVANVRALSDVVDSSVTTERFNMSLLSLFAGLAVVLASLGTYAVASYSVSQRKREIGIRMALGAEAGRVTRHVLGHGLVRVSAGIGVGVVGAVILMRWISGILYGVGATDPWTFVAAGTVLTVASTIAYYVPARRAARVDPALTLRCE